MTDNPNVETDGAGTEANVPASPEAVAGDANQLSELVKRVLADELKPIKGEISGLYSRQDKDRNQFREFMDEFKKQKASGLSDAEAEQAAQTALTEREKQSKRDQLIDKLAEKFLNESSTQTPGTGVSVSGELAQVIRDNQLDANDPAVTEIIAAHGGNVVKAAVALGKLAQVKASKPSASPAASTSITGGEVSIDPNIETLTAEYKNKIMAARGNKSLIKGLKDEYQKRGVPVDQVYFSV